MSKVHRFTTRYVAVEDRIRLSIELKDGTVQLLWLTRRLLNRLLPRLLNRLAGDIQMAQPATVSTPRRDKVVQKFTQQAAVGAIQPQPAVVPSENTPQRGIAVVVTKVEILTGPRSLVLAFRGGADILQSLPFTEEALRQWLGVLYIQYKTGEWREAFWPEWMEAPDPEDAVRHLN